MTSLSRADVACWGRHAQRFVERNRSASVAGVFTRGMHLQAGEDFLCIVDEETCKGPLNAIVGAAAWRRVVRDLPAAGSTARISAGSIEMGAAVFGTAMATTWYPPSWPSVLRRDRLRLALSDLVDNVREQAPADGLVCLVLGSAGGPVSVFERVAQPRVDRLQQWISVRLSKTLHEAAPVELLGVGPGLTPSGDDLLCGALVALHAVGRPDAARDLYAAIAEAAPSATSLLSRAFLKVAAEGQGWEPLHAAIIALFEERALGDALAAVDRIGGRSGWDALAGAVIVLQAIGSIAGHSYRVALYGNSL